MKNKTALLHHLTKKGSFFIFIVCGFLIPTFISAQLPTEQQLSGKMKLGWNLGNMLEATWIDHFATINQTTIDSVKAAGFNTVRLPVAWFYHSDTVNSKIEAIISMKK